MPVVTSHPVPFSLPRIDRALCTNCGICTDVCPTGTLVMQDGALAIEERTSFGCIACSHCQLACPEDAVAVFGRGADSWATAPLAGQEGRASAAQLDALLLARRSVRRFNRRDVPRAVVDEMLRMAASAPMGIPPSEVRVLVLCGRDKVQRFAADMDGCFRGTRVFFKSPLFALLRLGMKPADREFMRTFLLPLVDKLIEQRAEGHDSLLYDAPLVLLFHGAPYSDAADIAIAATYAMLAAEALGLGTCLIGSVSPFLQRNAKLLRKYNLPPGNKLGLVLVCGYSAQQYRRSVARGFAAVEFA